MTYETDYDRDVPAISFAEWAETPTEGETGTKETRADLWYCVTPLAALRTIGACYDAAVESIDFEVAPELLTVSERDEIDERARVLAHRILTVAQREARAGHSWWHGDRTTGDTERHSLVPDPMERARAKTRTTRSRKGTTTKLVTVHGRAYVQGSTATVPNGAMSMSADRATRALETCPRAAQGMDAVSLYRLTQVLFPDVPRLIGGDVLTFHEFRSWDEIRSATPRSGWATRYGLPGIGTPRNGERMPHRQTAILTSAGDVPEWTPMVAIPLVAPDVEETHAWRGFKRYVRPDTVRATRKAKARQVTGWTHIPETDDLAEQLGEIAAHATIGDRVSWTLVDRYGRPTDMSGFLTVTGTDKARFSVSGLPEPVRNYATPDGLAIAVARAIAS